MSVIKYSQYILLLYVTNFCTEILEEKCRTEMLQSKN